MKRYHVAMLMLALGAAPAAAQSATSAATGVLTTLPRDLSPWSMFVNADIVVKAVMVGLAFASLVTWTIFLAKGIELLAARRKARRGNRILAQAQNLREAWDELGPGGGPIAEVAQAAIDEIDRSAKLSPAGIKERLAVALTRIEARATRRMARGTGLLATIGATAPFVGLFGTVWGIMNSFIGISKAHATNLAVVAPGIAEALLATAIGLIAAIPAVVIYNVFARATAAYRGQLADASTSILQHVSRDFERQEKQQERVGETALRARMRPVG